MASSLALFVFKMGLTNRHRKRRKPQHFEGFTTLPGFRTSMPNDPHSQVIPLAQVSGYTALSDMPGAPWIYKVIDTNEATPRRFWYVVTPMGVFQNNNNGNQSEATATPLTDIDAFNDIFNQIFANINPWLSQNGMAGSSNVATLYRQLGMTGNWKSDSDPLPALGKYAQFLADITGSAGNVYQASYVQQKGGLAGVAQRVGAAVGKIVNDVTDVALAELIPLKPAMKAALKVATYPDANPPDDTTHLAQEFYKKVILNEQFESLESFAAARGVSVHASPVVKKQTAAAVNVSPVASSKIGSKPQAPMHGGTASAGSGSSATAGMKNDLSAGANANLAVDSVSSIARNAATGDVIAAQSVLNNIAAAALQNAQDSGGGGGGGGGSDDGSDDSYDDGSDDQDFGDDGSESDQDTGDFVAQGGDDSSDMDDDDFGGDDDMPGGEGGSDYCMYIDPYGNVVDDCDDDSGGSIYGQDDDDGDYEELEKQEKYAIGAGINSGIYENWEEERQGYDSFEDIAYLDGASEAEKKMYRRYKRNLHHLSTFEAFESLEGVDVGEVGAAAASGAATGAAAGPVGAGIGAIIAAILDWFKQAHNKVAAKAANSSAPTPTPAEAAADAAATATVNGMSQAQINSALGLNPFTNWFTNPDGTKNYTHFIEAALGIAAVALIGISVLGSD